MNAISLKSIFKGTSGDSFFLIFVRLVTLVFGIFITRVLSGHFSLHDYGTYSQIMLLITTISSMTMLGMMDGVNFFFCKENDEKKRNSYVSTIFALQYIISIVVSVAVLICSVPISRYFGNDSLKTLIIFAAILPVCQNSISLLQIMFIAIGKAKQIAIRNLIVSILKLIAVTISCYIFNNISVVFLCQLLTDVIQIIYFVLVLHKNNCRINVLELDKTLIKEILFYCIPMAMFSIVKALNRESDKFVISFFTDTETLAIYTNASKLLPFDIIMTSFCTVLLPYITRYIAKKEYNSCHRLYKSFLELSYVSTTILAMGAICVSPELMRFLYTDKYLSSDFGLPVFILYIFVDILSVLNITLILSAAGKTRTILFASLVPFLIKLLLNVLLFFFIGEIGPAISSLIISFGQGLLILGLGATVLKSNIFKMFDIKYFLKFALEIIFCVVGALWLRRILIGLQIHYMFVIMIVYGLFCMVLVLLNIKRLFNNLNTINQCKIGS